MQRATQVNEAFQTLKEPLSRGRYLLQLHGFDPNADNATAMANDFLLEQMELHEELADLKRQRQSEALSHFLRQLEQRMQKLTGTLSQQFAQHDYLAARDTVRQFQFFKRLQEEALILEEELT
jgi:molecular chaperone HscB